MTARPRAECNFQAPLQCSGCRVMTLYLGLCMYHQPAWLRTQAAMGAATFFLQGR